jgi:hypothetical protein
MRIDFTNEAIINFLLTLKQMQKNNYKMIYELTIILGAIDIDNSSWNNSLQA